MGKVTESIYSGKSVIVPLADVSHIEKLLDGQLVVVTKHTRWDFDRDFWANNIVISADEADAFKSAWCRYRSELEAHTLADLTPGAGLQMIEALKDVDGRISALLSGNYSGSWDKAVIAIREDVRAAIAAAEGAQS